MVANPERGESPLVVQRDGETVEYVLKLSNAALRALEQRRQKPFGTLLQLTDELDVTTITDVLFMLLQKHHGDEVKNLTKVDALIDEAGGPMKAYHAIVELLKLNRAEGPTTVPQTAPGSTGGGPTSTPAE